MLHSRVEIPLADVGVGSRSCARALSRRAARETSKRSESDIVPLTAACRSHYAALMRWNLAMLVSNRKLALARKVLVVGFEGGCGRSFPHFAEFRVQWRSFVSRAKALHWRLCNCSRLRAFFLECLKCLSTAQSCRLPCPGAKIHLVGNF